MRPTVRELVRGTSSIEVSAESLLERLGVRVSGDLSDAADERVRELQRRTAARELIFPERFAVEHESARFLYMLVRSTRPDLMVETGVANGASTFLILAAMKENGIGRLVSIDISDRVAGLLTDEEREAGAWELRVIEPGGFAAALDGLDQIDVFMHDSDHSYENVVLELTTAWPRIRPGGIIISDDGEHTFGFIDAMEGRAERTYGLFDRRKVLMAARR